MTTRVVGAPVDAVAGPGRRLATLVAAAAIVAGCSNGNLHYDQAKAHHRLDGFLNNYGPPGGKPLSDLLIWHFARQRNGDPKPPSTHVDGYDFPSVRPDPAALRAGPPAGEVALTWVGHSTLLLQVGGVNVLTDPQFSERAFPVQWMGPKRRAPLPLRIDALPPIHVVLISHNHYDHLDVDSVRALLRQPGGEPLFAVPLGVDAWMRAQGATRIAHFDWWDRRAIAGLELTFVPAQHWSARSLDDRNETLWGGWVLRTPGFSFYFAGDTGYSRDFADIGSRFGGFDLAAIPVGAYLPRWFMKEQHVNPEEAVRIHRDVKARRSVGIHWGTFELTDEPLDAPIGELPEALSRHGIDAQAFVLYRHGETRRYAIGAAAGARPSE